MGEMNTIKGEWENLKTAVFRNIPDWQIDEMEQLFYSGAASAINIMIRISEDEISENAGAEIFEGIRKECNDFFNLMKDQARAQIRQDSFHFLRVKAN